MLFFCNSLNNLIAKVPIFRNESGIKIEIRIEIKNISTAYIFLVAKDKGNRAISTQNLEKSQIESFLKEYRKYIEKGNYSRSESWTGRIRAAIQTAIMLLKNGQILNFYFSLKYSIPLTIINNFYTLDKFDNRCIAKTVIDGGKTYNIMDPKTMDNKIPFFHTLSLKMIYDLYVNENKHYIQIFEKITLYLRYIIPIIISIGLAIDLINSTRSNSLNWNLSYFYAVMLGISLFPNIIFRLGIWFFIHKNSLLPFIDKKIRRIKKLFK